MSHSSQQNHVYIVSGYTATPTSHWFPWLKEQLSQQGIHVHILDMPTPSTPVLNEWLDYIAQQIGTPDQHSFLVGHSLGCVSLLKFLEKTPCPTPVGGLILVAGFDQKLPNLKELDEFTEEPVDYTTLPVIQRKEVIASTNDDVVAFTYTQTLAKNLNASFHQVENAGHFLGREGFTTLPIVYDLLLDMIKQL